MKNSVDAGSPGDLTTKVRNHLILQKLISVLVEVKKKQKFSLFSSMYVQKLTIKFTRACFREEESRRGLRSCWGRKFSSEKLVRFLTQWLIFKGMAQVQYPWLSAQASVFYINVKFNPTIHLVLRFWTYSRQPFLVCPIQTR